MKSEYRIRKNNCIACLIVIAIGSYGCIFDFYNGMDYLIPNIFNMPMLYEYKIEVYEVIPTDEFKYNINVLFPILVGMGAFVLFISIGNFKAPYKGKKLIKYYYGFAKKKFKKGFEEYRKFKFNH